MNKLINFYPTLDDDQKKLLNIKCKYTFSFKNYEGEIEVVESNISLDKYIELESNTNWDKLQNDLIMEVDIGLQNANILYGAAGIAPTNSKIGLALEWYSQSNKIRKILPNRFVVNKNEEPLNINFSCAFPKETFDSKIDINIILYLQESSIDNIDEELFLNNEKGVLLGVIDHKELFMSGVCSLFPIYTQALGSDKNLWKLEISYEDPFVDQLIDSVKIIFNTKHKDFPLIDVNNKKYCDALVNEIIASAMTVLISKLKEEKDLDDIDKQCDDGSVIDFIKYCTTVLGLNISDSLKISNSFRTYLR